MSNSDSLLPRRDPLVEHLAYGEAAQMLMESLMLLLIEEKVLEKGKLLAAIDDVIITKRQLISANEHPEIAKMAVGILSQLSNSVAAAYSSSAQDDLT